MISNFEFMKDKSHPEVISTTNPEETIRLGERISRTLRAGDTVALFGKLGSGKTILTKGLAQGLGVQAAVTSPTFTIMHQYSGRLPVYHFDLYRLAGSSDLRDLGFDEYCGHDGVCIIEWAEKCLALLPAQRIEITLEALGENERRITITRHMSD
jgi:tRNA threonylcarbamoyladenosine biosynthesis protein TsaE